MKRNHHLAPLLAPASIALVGASPQPNTAGRDAMLELLQSGYKGRIYPVNPKYSEIDGMRAYPSLDALPEAPELTVLSVANSRLEELAGQAIRKGTQALVIFGSAHLEDDALPPLTTRIRQMAKEAGIPVCGANCMGFYNHDESIRVFPQHLPRSLVPGNITYISQSGSALTALLWNDQKLRFNLAVSSGQEIVTTVADYMDYSLELESTRVIAVFLESVREPAKFVRVLERARAKSVPVVVLKVGKTEASAALALSHTGAIVGNDAAYQAVFERYGVITVDTLDELAATAALLSMNRQVAAGGVAAILDSGGEREMIVDLAQGMGLHFAQINEATADKLRAQLDAGLDPVNPLDAWGTGRDYEDVFANCLQALVEDPNTGVGMLVADLTSSFRLHEGFARACERASAGTRKPIVVLTNHPGTDSHLLAMWLADRGICVLDGTLAGLTALRNAMRYRDFKAKPAGEAPLPVSSEVVSRWRARLSKGVALDEFEGLALLADYGIPVQRSILSQTLAGTLSSAEELGYPLVLKTAMPGILHKSDVGGVKLNLKNSAAVAAAYADLAERLGPRVLVGRMADGQVEIAVGVISDPQFGPLVMVAAGGIFIELLRDRRIKLAPFSAAEAKHMIDALACRPVLDGMRGAPASDVAALAAAVSRVSVLAADLGDLISEMDINPIKVGSKGCMAVDALVTLCEPSKQEASPHYNDASIA